MSPFSPAVVWMKQWKPCSFNYTPASISPAASFALSCCAVSQASSCLLLCKVIEMRRQAPSQTHRVPVTDTWALQWPIPSVKTGKRSPKQNKLLPFISFHCKGQKTWASPITQELPYIHCFEFFFSPDTMTLNCSFPSQNLPRKIKWPREEHRGFSEKHSTLLKSRCVTHVSNYPSLTFSKDSDLNWGLYRIQSDCHEEPSAKLKTIKMYCNHLSPEKTPQLLKARLWKTHK